MRDMQIHTSLQEITRPFHRPIVTIGNFDGVHLGHQLLFSEVLVKARRSGGTAVAVTFDPHPLKVLRPEGIRLISSTGQKTELIRLAGMDALVIIPFDRQFAQMSAAAFVEDILCRTLGVQELVIGYDYALGRGREGTIDFLRRQGEERGFPVTVVEAHYEDGLPVSSTRIRQLVTEGRMQEVRRLLGRCYHIRGEVQRGRQRGRGLGFPTANLHITEEDLCPKKGVYVTQVICGGRMYGSISNIGRNPTFGENELVAETHIFDFSDDIYGQPIRLNLLRHLRGEIKFNSADELAAQIRRDVETARHVLEDAAKERLLTCEEAADQRML
ncbi:MAG: riboflavin kinase [Candidatus Electronema aureum]|uniref:Riboflavin biosynthesis protein n=1 Tax=Candidatus Electronema aureum TaxID=2005002 RepID=A0A521FYE6_9BACT|nr:MAG: riboflavin kinase [Candidatus Electronema aureum]